MINVLSVCDTDDPCGGYDLRSAPDRHNDKPVWGV